MNEHDRLLNIVLEILEHHKKKSINLPELKAVMSGDVSQADFVSVIQRLECEKLLTPMGKNRDFTGLFQKYKIEKALLHKSEMEAIGRAALWLDQRINLAYYYKNPMKFQEDLPLLKKIDLAVKEGEVFHCLYLPELSLRLSSDEKWIEHRGGKSFLNDIGLWSILNPNNRSEPLAFALNSKICISSDRGQIYKHLILENKTTFKLVCEYLGNSDYATAIYGQGFGILSSILSFELQFPFRKQHEFHYFGDLDRSGIQIFDSLSKIIEVRPQIEFYHALLRKKALPGKETQKCDEKVIEKFAQRFGDLAVIIIEMLEQDRYLPQELLSPAEISELLRRREA